MRFNLLKILSTYHLLFVNAVILVFTTAVSFSQVQNNGDLRMHGNSIIGLYGDFTNEGNFDNNQGDFYLVGDQGTFLNGSNYMQVEDLVVFKTDTTHLDQIFEITGNTTFTAGVLKSDRTDMATEYFHFTASGNHSGAKDESHVDGVVRKSGSDPFIFPVGHKGQKQTARISAPSNSTDHFTAYYVEEDPHSLYSRNQKEAHISRISACEYWIIDRTGGSSNVSVELEYDTNSCGLYVPCEAIVVRWDGTDTEWKDHGNGGVNENIIESIRTGNSCTNEEMVTTFSPFTFGSLTPNNPLPITLTHFGAELIDQSYGELTWVTATEINNDYFIVEKSVDGIDWTYFGRMQGAGTSDHVNEYFMEDHQLVQGMNYYRLTQVDFDGKSETFTPQVIYFEKGYDFSVYPNPTKNLLTVRFSSEHQNDSEKIEILNTYGQVVQIVEASTKSGTTELSLEGLASGAYYIRINRETRKVLKL